VAWTAYYSDGTELNQFENGVEAHMFKDIDESRLQTFKVTNEFGTSSVNLNTGVFSINGHNIRFKHFPCDRRLVYFRRTRQTLGKGTQFAEFLGWQSTYDGRNVKVVAALTIEGIYFEEVSL
jgi:hypothetical protein